MLRALQTLSSSGRSALRHAHPSYALHVRGKKKKAARGGSKAAVDPDGDVDVDLSPYEESMHRTVDSFQRSLTSIRTSGAHPSLLDSALYLPK